MQEYHDKSYRIMTRISCLFEEIRDAVSPHFAIYVQSFAHRIFLGFLQCLQEPRSHKKGVTHQGPDATVRSCEKSQWRSALNGKRVAKMCVLGQYSRNHFHLSSIQLGMCFFQKSWNWRWRYLDSFSVGSSPLRRMWSDEFRRHAIYHDAESLHCSTAPRSGQYCHDYLHLVTTSHQSRSNTCEREIP